MRSRPSQVPGHDTTEEAVPVGDDRAIAAEAALAEAEATRTPSSPAAAHSPSLPPLPSASLPEVLNEVLGATPLASATEASASPAATPPRAARDSADLPWCSRPKSATLALARKQLGITQEDTRRRTRKEYRAHGIAPEIVEMRFKHAETRRQELSAQLRERYESLKAQQAQQEQQASLLPDSDLSSAAGLSFAGGVSSAGAAGPLMSFRDVAAISAFKVDNRLTAKEKQLEVLARRRAQEVARTLEQNVKAAIIAQEHDAIAERQRRLNEEREALRARAQRSKQDERRKQEEKLAARQAEQYNKRQQFRRSQYDQAQSKRKQAEEKAEAQLRAAREREVEKTRRLNEQRNIIERYREEEEQAVRARLELVEKRSHYRAAMIDEQKKELSQMLNDRMRRATERVESASRERERMLEEQRAQFEARSRETALRREEQRKRQEEEIKRQKEVEVVKALQRGLVYDKMKSNEEARINTIKSRQDRQATVIQALQRRRKLELAVKEEQRQLREQDRRYNVERIDRIDEFEREELRKKLTEEDERAVFLRQTKQNLIESFRRDNRALAQNMHRLTSLIDRGVTNLEDPSIKTLISSTGSPRSVGSTRWPSLLSSTLPKASSGRESHSDHPLLSSMPRRPQTARARMLDSP